MPAGDGGKSRWADRQLVIGSESSDVVAVDAGGQTVVGPVVRCSAWSAELGDQRSIVTASGRQPRV